MDFLIEAMACGAPVLALPGGSVSEIVGEGVSGYVCHAVDELAFRATHLNLGPREVRSYAEARFSVHRKASQYSDLYQALLCEKDSEPIRPLQSRKRRLGKLEVTEFPKQRPDGVGYESLLLEE